MKSKLLKRDYNEELEEITEQKNFDKEVQNLLLSMLYKADGAYSDYEIVKREVPFKEDFFENIIEIIEKYCKEIVVAKPNSPLEQELEQSRCKILEEEPDNKYNEEQKVIVFPNEKVVLYSIVKAGIEKIDTKLNLENKAILMAIQIGKCIAYSEVIRDFNGFSWTTSIAEIESIECNSIYTDLIYLLGEEYVDSLNSQNISKLKNQLSSDLYEEIKKVATTFYLKYDTTQKNVVDENLENDKAELEKMKNREQYVEEIAKSKRDLLEKIRVIDEVINNPDTLKKEYLEKNANLPNEKKIFSISHYEEMLQNERNAIMEKIDKYNELQNPIKFVEIKENLEKNIKYHDSLKETNINEMQKLFLRDFGAKTINDKEQLRDYIYEIRYLKFLPINKEQNMGDVIEFETIEKKAIIKGIEFGLITPISNSKKTDYELLKSIFDTRTINLEELYMRLVLEENKLVSEIYDGTELDSKNKIELPEGSNVQLRKTKRVKIFD